jgi:hypothetical protein
MGFKLLDDLIDRMSITLLVVIQTIVLLVT